MLKNFLTLALRNLLKRRLFSFINIFGLALGIAACLVILKYMDFETSYDSFHENAANLYRISRTVSQGDQEVVSTLTTSYALGPTLKADIPEVRRTIRTHPMYGGAVMIYQPPTGEARAFHESNIQMVDSTFLRSFTYRSLKGDATTALDNSFSVVITKTIAEKYFGKEEPLGKTLTLTGGWSDGDYNVAAVIENVPDNSHFYFEVLLPTHNLLLRPQYQNDNGWGWNNFVTYVELEPGASNETLETKLDSFAKQNIDVHHKEENYTTKLNFQPIKEIHLSPGLKHEEGNVSRSTVYFFGVIAVFILFIAWINYINLSTARAMERSREVGIKKAVGAFRSQLVIQFLCESIVINLCGIILAIGLAMVLLPMLGEIMGKHLSFDFSDLRLWLTLSVLFVFGSAASGVYPAFAMSSYRITDTLKPNSGGRGFSLRKALVVFQFSASLLLIAGTFSVYRQITFMRNRDKGLQMDQMLVVSGPSTLPWRTARQRTTLFKEELRNIPGVTGVATSAAIPGGGHNWGADIRRVDTDPSEFKNGSVVWIDPDFINTYDIKFIAGRNFNVNLKSDMKTVIVNEASLTAYGLGSAEDALEQRLIMGDDTLEVVGVLKNYNWNSLKSEHVPFLFRPDTIATSYVSIHLATTEMNQAIEAVNDLYKELIPGDPFQYYFLDDFFNEQYKSDQQFGKIFGLFAILAVAISCLGLWGLASFTTTQKLKEIGVRKVLGASIGNIVYLLSGQFMRLVLIAAVITLPLTWYGVDSWLKGFAFRIGLEWDIFVVPLLILGTIALLTVSFQVIKGAATNPAKVLRSE